MKNNKGQIGIIAIVALVAVVLIGGFMVINSGTKVSDNTSQAGCADSTGVLTLTAIDALQLGTTVATPTITCGSDGKSVVDSVTSGTTTYAVGDSLDCLVSKTGYLDVEYTGTMTCGGLTDSVNLYQSTADNPSITIKDLDVSTSALTDNLTGKASSYVNATNIAAGDVLNLVVQFQGTSLESSGEGIYVIELPASSNANITAGTSGVTLGNLAKVAVPTVHTSQNAGSRIDAFAIPAIVGSDVKTYDLLISTQASKDLMGGVYTDWYAKQAFVDSDGAIKVGVENSLGTAAYENTLDYDFYIPSA